jgi:lysozyme family protein
MKTTPIQQIVNLEARRDAQGRIAVYSLPSGDGGGSFEIAGINEKYHPGMAKRLRQLINAGQHGQAETEAGNYIKQYTDPVAKHATNPGVEFALRDTAFNRGPTGAARILQKALGVKVDGKIGPVTREALAKAEANPKQFLQDIRQTREWYERSYAKREPGNKFWRGLVNRWDKQLAASMELA